MADISKVVLPNNSEYDIKDTTARSGLNNKVDKVSGKGLSTNDYTTTEKNKLSGIAEGAEVNVQSDWNESSSSSDAFIKNKPTIPTKTSDLTNNSNFVSDASYVHTDNNYTTTEKNKLSGIATGAEANVQSDWNVTDTSSDAFIKNKPTIPTDTWKSFYGTCTTAAATKDKVVTVSSDQNFSLRVGTIVGVKFSYTNTYSNATASPITLNVNSTGAKNIWYNTTHSGGGNTGAATHIYGTANRYTWYMYDGTYWVWIHYGVVSNSNTVPSAQCETAAGTAAKAATCTNFALKANSYLHFNIRYANTSATALTMNVNSTGAKAIYINGAASSTSNYTLPAGSYIAFYNGTYWDFRTDGKLPASITGDAATVNGHTVASDVPANAKFTDTTYSDATTSAAGLMSSSDKTKLNGIATGAEVNVQSDWNVTDASSDAFIKNKPSNLVSDASYVHTDNNYTTTEKNKLSGIATGAEANVQSDWDETDTTSDAYILNKPNPYLLENFIAIPDGSDLNDYTTPGEYYVSSESTSVSHCPRSGFAFRLRVENNPTDSYIKQTFSIRVNNNLYPDPITWIRFYRSDTQVWGSWKGDTPHLMAYINLHDNDDLNSFIELGEYECTLSSRALTITNRPSDVNVAFRLRVEAAIQGYSGSSTTYLYRRQTLWAYTSSNVYYTRTYIIEGEGTATWSSWIKCGVPISHASTATTYGQGNASNYGHVKLSDTYSSSVSGGNAAGGIAASQNALYNLYSGVTDGSIVVNKAKYLAPPNAGAYTTDADGNFTHKRTTTNDYFCLEKNDGTDSIRFYFETGKITSGGRTVVWPDGDASIQCIATGYITSSQKRIVVTVPVLTSCSRANIKSFSCVARHNAGGYIYMCYGSSNNQYLQLGTSKQKIVDNYVGVHQNGCNNYAASVKETSVALTLDFANTLRTNAGTNVVTNNSIVSLDCTVVLDFY